MLISFMNVYIGLIRESGLMSAHCCTLLNDFEMTEKLFLLFLLKMRCNLLQFDKVLIMKIK